MAESDSREKNQPVLRDDPVAEGDAVLKTDPEKSALIYSERFAEYELSDHHPYKPSRGKGAYELLKRYSLLGRPGMQVVEPGYVELSELSMVHSPEFLQLLRHAEDGDITLEMLSHGIGTEDCPVFKGLLEFLSISVGATVRAMEMLLNEGCVFAFNPLGGFHHAGRAMAEGFCYVNDVAFVAKQLIDRGLRVAVIDIDAHHGNGTQDIFYEEPRVLTVSFHESGKTLYPWGGEADEIGEGPGRGYNVNIPLPMSSDDEIFLFAFNEIAPPLLRAFSPDVVFGVMGVDTFSTDPLTHLKLTNNSYAQAARSLHKLSPRWIALGAGGYNMDNVSRGYALLWATVHGLDQEDDLTSTLGGAMLGEADLGVASLRDSPFRTSGPEKEQALAEVEKSVDYVMDNVFPILGAG